MFEKMGGIIAKRMHKETAELFQRGEKSTTDEGAPVYGAPSSLGNIQCNVQPYSADLAQKEYGLKVEATQRMFALPDERLKIGQFVRWKDTMYRITALPEPGGIAVALLEVDNGATRSKNRSRQAKQGV